MTHPAVSAASTLHPTTPFPVPPVPPPPSGCSALSPLACSGCTSVYVPAAVLSAVDRLQDTIDHAARLGPQALVDAACAVQTACRDVGLVHWHGEVPPEALFIGAKMAVAKGVCHRLADPMLDALEAACRALSTPPLFLAK